MKFGNSNGNVFREYPGAVVTGIVAGGTGVDTLAFGAGVGLGTFSGIGNQFTGFEVLELDPHANWRAIGADTLATSATIRLSGAAVLRVAGTLVAPANLTMAGLGTLVAATTGHIEVGTAGTAHGGQIVVDAAHTLISSGALSARVILNRGTITGASGYGVQLLGAGAVTNSGTAALISGAQYGVYAPAGVANVFNQGKIIGSAGAGVYFGPGGTVTNSGTPALISGGQWGVESTGPATVVNQGTITGAAAGGVQLFAGGLVTNTGTGARIAGGVYGVELADPGSLLNQGTIIATSTPSFGAYLPAGGAVTNSGTATLISAQQVGVVIGTSSGNRRQLRHNHRLIDLGRGHRSRRWGHHRQ